MKQENINKGKKARADGQRFELKVRKDLESKKWIVDKWSNNVDLEEDKLIIAKPKMAFNPIIKRRILLGNSSGFPDFISFKNYALRVIGVESKMNGKLDKQEKLKCDWLLKNNIFFKIYIASDEIDLQTGLKKVLYTEYKGVKKHDNTKRNSN